MIAAALLLAAVAPVLAASNTDAVSVCQHLHTAYPQYTVWDPTGTYGLETFWNQSYYSNAVKEYWNGVNADNRPACAFFPATAQQVSVAVQQLNKYPTAPFALKGGGHNFNVGFSSTNGGVLISFNENMSSTTRNSDGQSFDIGPGARWGDVYAVTQKTNQVVGLACDNVVNFEVVLGNGTIINANSDSNPDLWWALRGGGNRFGIVTKFTLKAHPLGDNGQVWGGIRSYSADKREQIFEALSKFTSEYPDAKAAIIPTFEIGLPGALISNPAIFFFYDGAKPSANAFAGLEDIEPFTDSTNTTSYTNITNAAGGAKIYGINAAIHVNTFPNMPSQQMTQLLETHWTTYQSMIKNDSSRNLDLQLGTFTPQPLSVRIARASQNAGGNALGLDPANGDRIWVENDLIWLNPACNDACPGYLHEVGDTVKEAFNNTLLGTKPTNYQSGDVDWISSNPLFMNDAANYQDVYGSYGPTNKARLASIAKAYDPTGFMFRQGGWSF
ncbi:FAD dependent oxidoreductase [Aspergillus eucalypticola CBS 122712]|uniref:FAD dependent oxidoreductase n=1 Tax=Aspergillus eucalypticola (strain CBS 122712 / IBT 29274) TaxID=1448314 RepID=A0A317VTX7_ASPEC|nr:FAD dependent oxidoreductase [Aspergillus eucalypticola CBS 122712]PWY76781.1 FAD dependent oxidoreductase [Aspergillus eucalypticola CBS 122712]